MREWAGKMQWKLHPWLINPFPAKRVILSMQFPSESRLKHRLSLRQNHSLWQLCSRFTWKYAKSQNSGEMPHKKILMANRKLTAMDILRAGNGWTCCKLQKWHKCSIPKMLILPQKPSKRSATYPAGALRPQGHLGWCSLHSILISGQGIHLSLVQPFIHIDWKKQKSSMQPQKVGELYQHGLHFLWLPIQH